MFDLGWDEMAVIAVVALVVLGPKELPNALRTVSGLMKQARKLANEFQSGVHQIIREAELEDAKNAIADIKNKDIAGAIEKHLDSDGEIKAALKEPLEAAANSAAIAETENSPTALAGAKAEEAIAGPAIGQEVNPAVAAYEPGGSATQLPEFAHEDALGDASETVSEVASVEGDPVATPVETNAVETQSLNFGHEDALKTATASDLTASGLTPADNSAENKISGDKEKSKIS
jgi:sec-independent protein translocase protein TatB